MKRVASPVGYLFTLNYTEKKISQCADLFIMYIQINLIYTRPVSTLVPGHTTSILFFSN